VNVSGKSEAKILSFPNDYGLVSCLEVFPGILGIKQENDKASLLLAFERRVATKASLPSEFKEISNRRRFG